MQDELSFLIKLQDHDKNIDALLNDIASFGPLVQSKNQKIELLKDALKTAKDALTSHQMKKKQLELDAEAQEKLVQKHQAELNSLKSNDAYKAMLGEIQNAKNAVIKIEDDILSVMEKLDAGEKMYKEKEKQFKIDEAAIKSEIQTIEAKKSDLTGQLKTKQEERAAFAATVPPPFLAQYDAIREKRGGLAIVPMVNGTSCGGCQMKLTPNNVNEVKKAKTMVLCESCSRILYMPISDSPAVTPPSDPQAVSALSTPSANS